MELPKAKEITNYGEQVKAMKNKIIGEMGAEIGSGEENKGVNHAS